MGCTRNVQGTLTLPWSDERVGPGRVSREAVLATNSNEASLELERCRSSTGLRDKINRGHATRQIRNTTLKLHSSTSQGTVYSLVCPESYLYPALRNVKNNILINISLDTHHPFVIDFACVNYQAMTKKCVFREIIVPDT